MSAKIVIPSSGTIDLYDEVPIPLTYSIADIREPDKRNSSYSKTIKVPGTANNNKIFGHIFNVNTALTTFDPNKKAYCYLVSDDVTVMTGYLQLTNIDVLDNNEVEYDVFLLGEAGNPFYAMGNLELTDLDFSEFDHTYNYATQVGSWTNTWVQGYCYPYIDYGFDADTDSVDVEHMMPAIFAKTYVNKILGGIGYTYTSSFLDSSFFENLIIPANANNIVHSATAIEGFLFDAEQITQSSGTVTGSTFPFTTAWFNVIYDSEIGDPSGQYNPVTGEWTIGSAGHYNIYGSGTFYKTTTGSFGAGTPTNELGIWVNYGSGYQFIGSSYSNVDNLAVTASNIFLNVGDKVKIMFRCSFGQNSSGTIVIAVGGGEFYNSFVNSGLIEGNTLELNNAVPIKIKQKDFMLSLIKMFNLYVDIDTNNPQNLIIETRDDYYSSGTIVDWSSKLDYNSPVMSKPMGALDYKEFQYNYTSDKDYYNKQYEDKYKEIYGNKRYVTNNEFLTNVNETKVIFSPSPLVNNLSNDRILTTIWAVDNSNNVSHQSFNIRILYNGGVKTTLNTYDYIGRYSGSHLLTQYLYAGHLDSPQNPTLDLNFGVPHEVFYDTTVYTNNNLFNRFFSKQLAQLTDIDSRIVTARFRLRTTDINNLSFRNSYYFDGQLFLLNEIKDYDPRSEETVECSFLKLVTVIGETVTPTQVNGGWVDNYENGYPFIYTR